MNVDYYFCRKFIPFLNLPLFFFGRIALLAILGLFGLLPIKNSNFSLIIMFIVVYFATLMVLFIASRYRFLCVPFLIILASFSLYEFVLLVKSGAVRKCILLFLLFSLIFFMVNKPGFGVKPGSNFPVAHTNLGEVYRRQGRLEDAAREYKQAIILNPIHEPAYRQLGITYNALGNREKAIDMFHQAIKLNPHSEDAYYNLAVLYKQKTDYQMALNLFKQAKAIRPKADIYYNLGVIYLQIKQYHEAKESLKAALELFLQEGDINGIKRVKVKLENLRNLTGI